MINEKYNENSPSDEVRKRCFNDRTRSEAARGDAVGKGGGEAEGKTNHPLPNEPLRVTKRQRAGNSCIEGEVLFIFKIFKIPHVRI